MCGWAMGCGELMKMYGNGNGGRGKARLAPTYRRINKYL
jgi:hypothetical protein